MKIIIGVTSILATLIAPSIFAAGLIDGGCREADKGRLETKIGIGSSSAISSVQTRQWTSLTAKWTGYTSLAELNNVSVRVNPNTPSYTRAQFVIRTNKGVFISPYINRDTDYRDGNQYCFELDKFLKSTARNEISGISVRFLTAPGENIAIHGLSYTGVPEGATDYTLIDHLEPSADYPKTMNFEIPNSYNEYLLNADTPLAPFGIDLTLICDDQSTHHLGFGNLADSPFGLKLNIEGLCAVNAQLEITSNMFGGTEYWLHGK